MYTEFIWYSCLFYLIVAGANALFGVGHALGCIGEMNSDKARKAKYAMMHLLYAAITFGMFMLCHDNYLLSPRYGIVVFWIGVFCLIGIVPIYWNFKKPMFLES